MKAKKVLITILSICILSLLVLIGYFYFNQTTYIEKYLASDNPTIEIIDEDKKLVTFIRGTKVELSSKTKKIDDVEYKIIRHQDKFYYLLDENQLCDNKEDAVLEKTLYILRTCCIYEDDNSSKIKGMIEKGNMIEVTGHSELLEDGTVERYEFNEGYLLNKYVTQSEEEAISNSSYLDNFKGIFAYDDTEEVDLDFYPNEKPEFSDNQMPDEVKALYINDAATYEMDDYIALAKEIGANALVIDIRDSHVVNVKADTMKEYCPSAYEAGNHSKEEFTNMITKCKENGLYTIARITVFKDPNYANDHPDQAILDKDSNDLFVYGAAKWPSAYSRECWEYNVELAKECISDMGFNEIQFDYVRFPEQVGYYNDIEQGIDLRNTYNETRSEAIQRFLIYACDEIHAVHGYVSADVFGETSNNYICDYGQYWPAISNVVDVVSAMPYPDHFSAHDYGISEYVWEVPYKLMYNWALTAKMRQNGIPTPAKVRTWLQGYNSIREPLVIYDAEKVKDQVDGLKDADLYDGFMIWNSLSDYEKYKSYKKVFE